MWLIAYIIDFFFNAASLHHEISAQTLVITIINLHTDLNKDKYGSGL